MAPTSPMRVFLIDSLALIHAGMRQMLGPFSDIELTGGAYAASDALRQCARERYEVILVEIDDLGPDWMPPLAQLVRAAPASHVVVFTMHASPTRVQQALRAGVHGFLLKQMQLLSLAQALRSIASGQQVFAPEATQAILVAQVEDHAPREALSQREREILNLLAHGLSNQAIAARLCVSCATVKFHCRNLFTKLGVASRAEAVAAAYRRNLVPHLVADFDQREHPKGGEEADLVARRAYA